MEIVDFPIKHGDVNHSYGDLNHSYATVYHMDPYHPIKSSENRGH